MTAIKFCGLTRPEDARAAAVSGAAYAGVIFAGGPRNLTVERAYDVLNELPSSVRRVGVFAAQSASDIARATERLGLDVVQLHGESSAERVSELRRAFGGEVWTVVRVAGSTLPASFAEAVESGDGVLLDAYVPGALGGTGVALPWSQLGEALDRYRGSVRVILAGGLKPENVAQAIAELAPDVVDVSSGVERAPGIKDHDRIRAFAAAVSNASLTAS